jgi:hypothetical protein
MNSKDSIDDKKADELVGMIDALMSQGGGRVKVTADDSVSGIKVNTFVSSDCADGEKSACCQPTETAIDETEDE